MSRRQFAKNIAALSVSPLAPARIFADSNNARRVVVRTDVEIGTVRPELHGEFAEHPRGVRWPRSGPLRQSWATAHLDSTFRD